MATKKREKTIDELLRERQLEQIENFSIDDGEEEHSIDQIIEAASQQGIFDLYNPFEERAKRIAQEEAQAPKRPTEARSSRQTVDQFGNLGNMVKKTESETLPKITNEAIRNYNLSKVGRDYLSKYDDSTSYADIQKDIAEVQSKKGEDEYDLALAMLKNYVNQKYDLNGTDLSQDAIKRRQEVYDYNQNEIDRLNQRVDANEGDTENINLDDEETVSKYLNHDKNAVDFFMGYRSGRIAQDAANQEKYITMRDYIENAANSDSVRGLRNEAENLRAQNAAYDRTQGQSDRYALQYGDDVNNEKSDLLAGTLHTRNNVPDNFDERVENGNDRFTDMGDISKPAIKRYGGENAVEDYNNIDAHTEMLTSEEKGIYSYLLRNEGEVSANAYLDSLKDVLQKRASETTQEYIDNASGAEKAVLLAASVPMNVYGTVTGFAEDAANIAAGKDIHPYSEAHSMYNIAQQTRSSVAEDIDYATNSWNVLGFSAGDAFQAAMSIPDFMLGSLTPSYYAASMSMGAAQSTAKELWEEGATNEQIVAESVLSGAAEYVFEKVSLDKILDTADKSKLVKSALAGMAIEGSEEANTEIANIISDVLVRGSQSEWHKAIQSYKDQGYSDSESQAKAFSDMAKRVGYSAIGGAIGGAGGGAGVAIEKGAGLIQNKSERNKYIASVGADVTEAGNTQALLDTADQMKDNAAVQAQAQKVRQAQTKNAEKGTESSAKALLRETGKLYSAIQDSNAQVIQNAEADEIKAAVKQAYAAETGEDVKSDTVTKAAEAIFKSEYTGEKLTRAERNLVSTSQAQSAVESVRNNPDLIEQGAQKAQERAFNKYISTAQLTQKQETKADKDVDIAEFNVHEDDNKVYTADGKKQVDIASVASIGKNDITFALSDGKTESAKALDMPTQQAVLAQSVLDVQKNMGMDLTTEIANTLYKGYEQSKVKSVSEYMQDAQTVLFNGYTNNTKIDNTIKLPQWLRNQLYSMGRQLATSHTHEQQQAVNKRINGNKVRKGTVTFVDGIKRGQLDARRRAGVDTVEALAQSLGFDVVFYRSTKNGKGRYSSEYVRKKEFTAEGQQAPSGFWRGGKMYLDVNAGMNGEGLILFTASHELVHLIREGSPEMFQELADFLVQNYAEQGVDVNDLISKEMNKSTNLTPDEAFEEVIAESCETFLRDTHLNGKAKELYKQNPSLWSRIREALKRIINAIKEAYAVARPQSEEASITNRADIETLEKAYDLWTNGIIKSAENLRNMESNSTDTKYQGREESTDAEYLDAVERGDMKTAQRMVDEAAKAAGYNTPMLYHGTRNFGFTQFDLNKMDDKMSIFLTSTPETASTYSGVTGKRGISEKYFNKNLFDMSANELVKTANRFINERGKGRDIEYRYYTKNDLLKMADEVQDGLSRLKEVAKKVGPEYANKAMRGFDDSALRAHTIINNMLNDIKNGESYNWIGAAINQLANETDEFNTSEFKKLSDTLFVLGEIQDSGILRAGEEEAILRVRPDLLLYEYESNVRVAHELQKKMSSGNYATYAKLDNPLIIDAKGASWNQIPITNQMWDSLTMLQKGWDKQGNKISYTRSIAEYAKEHGYDGVVFKNLEDNGGKNDLVHTAKSDVYVVFDSAQVKSADPVTYDNDGKVIPLSQRFDSTQSDIRYQSRDDLFSIDLSDDDTITDVAAREFVTHHEDMGEVLKNISDIDIKPKRVDSIINRVTREYLGSLDAEAKHTLSIEIQLALERVNNTDAQTVSDTIIDAVRRAIEKGTVSDERAEANYKELFNAFKGKKFYLTDEQINQLKEHDMTLDSFRKAMFGKVTIVKRENAKRSINGGYADAQQLSLEGLHDVLADADAVLGLRSWQWDQENYDAPYIIKEAFDGLNALRNQPVSQVYSDQAIDDMAIAMSAKITGGIVEAKYNSRKNPYITKLVDNMKSRRAEAVRKQKEKNKKKLSELKQKERERAEKRETELKKKYQEQRDKSREGRKRTELRHKIRNLTDSLQKRLTKPKGSQYVPRQLIAQTVDVLNAVNLDTGRSVRLSEKLALLRNEYDKLKDREESYAMYDGVISNMLLGLNDTVGNTSIMDMTLSQLKQVYDTIRSMDHVIRESVKMTDTNFKHDAHQVGRDWIAEIRAVPKERVGALSGYVQTMLSAERFFNRIAGFKKDSTSLKLFDMLNKGQLATTQYEMEFTQIFADLIQDDKIKSLYDTKNMVDIGLVDEDGNKVQITRGMMLSLYMHLQNEDNIRHVMGGGLTVPDMKDYYNGNVKKAFGKGMKSVRVGQLDYSRYAEGIKSVIEKQLTEYERGWIEAAHEFFDGASRKALNETTMKLYGFRRANVNNYFPIHTDSNYRAASFENIVRDMSLENSGFMKERVKASNPILLEDIVDVVNDQISKTAKYCGMTLPIKNFEKVYGTTTVGFDTSVQKELNKKFSASSSNTGATKYIDNLMTDLTSGRSSDDGPIAKWLGHARGFLAQSTLTLNPRVAIAQTASVVTAAPVVGYKNITKALTSQYFKVSDEEIAEITPLFWLRRQGYATIEIGDIATLRKQKHKIQSKAAKALNWINAMDSWAVRRLFVASKYYMQEYYSNLDPQSGEYKQKLSEVYNKVIEKTQPNYTVLQRPDILRNPNALLKSLTMFMTQRLQNFNIIYDSVGTFNKYNADYKAGINNVTADDVKEARRTMIRSITSQVASAATIVGMKLFADFLLHSVNGYRDDDDEITVESLSLSLLDNFADTVFGNILFASELYSAVKSLVFKKRYYGVSLSGISSVVDAITDIINLNNGVTVESVNKVAMSVCQVLGIPLRNAEKIGKSIYYWIYDISSGEFMESGIERNTKQNIHRYETKLLSGDNDGAKKIVDEMLEKKKAKGKNDKDAKSDVRSNFTNEYKKRYLEALKSNNAEEIKNIRQTLYSSELYGTLSDLDKVMQKWVSADKKDQFK